MRDAHRRDRRPDPRACRSALAEKAETYADAVMPGFTHLQSAQPVTFGHHLLAYVEMLARDRGRFADCRRRLNESPLGAAALAGTAFPIDRARDGQGARLRPPDGELARLRRRPRFRAGGAGRRLDLRPCISPASPRRSCSGRRRNSASSQLSDRFTTGSSIMPQKRNPDAAELVRAKTGRIIGDLTALLVVMKGLPLAYSKDMQEDKEQVFDALPSLSLSLAANDRHGPGHDPRTSSDARSRRRPATRPRPISPTGWCARPGLPFREAHHVAGRIVAEAAKRGVALEDLPLEAMQAVHPNDHAGRLRRPLRRGLGGEPHQLRRHRARERARGGARLDRSPCGRDRAAESECVSARVRYSRASSGTFMPVRTLIIVLLAAIGARRLRAARRARAARRTVCHAPRGATGDRRVTARPRLDPPMSRRSSSCSRRRAAPLLPRLPALGDWSCTISRIGAACCTPRTCRCRRSRRRSARHSTATRRRRLPATTASSTRPSPASTT